MRVLYLVDMAEIGGAMDCIVEFLPYMKAKGVECVVLTSLKNSFNDALDQLEIENHAVDYLPAMEEYNVKPWLKLIRLLQFYKHNRDALKRIEQVLDVSSFDIIHTNSARIDIGAVLANKYHKSHILHVREFGYSIMRGELSCHRFNYTKFINKNTNYYISVSDYVKDAWVKKGLNPSKFVTIYDGVDNSRIESAELSDITQDPLRFVIVGGIFPLKGQYKIIEAISLLPDECKNNITVDMLGCGAAEYINLIIDKAHEIGFNNLNLPNKHFDIPPILKNYHVGLMCSRAEGFGRVTAEYMHAGLGVIASNMGSCPELIDDGVNGLIFDYNNPQSLADCIMKYYNDRSLIKKHGDAANTKASSMFTSKTNADNIYNLYQSILS